MNKIKLGLPKGSLNREGRGNTEEILLNAGYKIRGYQSGNESSKTLSIENDPEIDVFLTKPKSAPVELSRGLLDVAIIGEDWVREEQVNGKNCITRIGDLEYGKTRLVVAVPNETTYRTLSDFFIALEGRDDPILCFTEYVNLTRKKFMENEAYLDIFENKKPLVHIRGFSDGENPDVEILNSDGVTEGYIAKGADIIVDNTQTGETLKEYGLRELEEIMKSSAGLYAGPSCVGWKREKADEIFEQLYGAIRAKAYFDVKFNVPIANEERLKNYLVSQKLCANEPTIIKLDKYSAVNILIRKETFPEVLKILKEGFGASAIVRTGVKQYIE